ncbi:MAG TPA: Imm1 family immunity protein [Stellaceae bacterium]|nr:Imm1 family immunity protein [Stellaceae bacterium]
MSAPYFCELVGDKGYNLLLGIGKDIGCAQYSLHDGTPPVLVALAPDWQGKTGYTDFLITDTASEVPNRFCLPMELVKRIAIDFQENGTASSLVLWETL